jgi:hypothetical protein
VLCLDWLGGHALGRTTARGADQAQASSRAG